MKLLVCLILGLVGSVEAAELTVVPQNGMPLVSAAVDGVACTLLVDTGASHTTLDLGFVTNRLASATVHDVELVGQTNVATVPKFVETRQLTVGEMTFATEGLMALDLAHLHRAVGRRVDGILGMNHLRQKPCVVSLRRQKLIWEPSATERAGFCPLKVRDRGTTFEVLTVTPTGQSVALLVDTGSTFTFVDASLWPPSDETVTMEAADVNVRAACSFRRGKTADVDCGSGSRLTLSPVLTSEMGRNQLGSDVFRTHDLLIDGEGLKLRGTTAEKYQENVVPAVNQVRRTAETFGADPVRASRRIAFVGNSITRHAPKPSIGWTNDCGMAASSIDKDYVHVCADELERDVPGGAYRLMNVAGALERTFMKSEWKPEQYFAALKDFKPDIVVFFFGANVPKTYDADPSSAARSFGSAVESLARYLDTGHTRFLISEGFYVRPVLDAEKKAAAERLGATFVAMDDIRLRDDAHGRFNHPSDVGMRLIAERFATSIRRLSAVPSFTMRIDDNLP